jgi:hypothetical protein
MTQDDLEINSMTQELIAAKKAAAGRSVPDSRLNKQIQDLQNAIQQKKSATLSTPGMRKGGLSSGKQSPAGSVIKKSGSKAAKAGVTKFSPVKTKKMAEGGLTKKQTAKVGKVMGEFKDKSLHSGKGGPVVKNPKQAIAIALSEARKVKKK